MTEKDTGIWNSRRAFRRSFSKLEKLRLGFLSHLSVIDILVGLGMALVVTSLLVGYQFQDIPDYKVGDIADRNISAPYDFPVEDNEATLQRQQEVIQTVPGIFNVDLNVNTRLESKLRAAFAVARSRIAEEREKRRISASRPLSRVVRSRLLPQLAELVPEFSQGKILEICLAHDFHVDLESQMVKLLRESLKYPGVVLSRDVLVLFQNRGILLRNTLTGNDEFLKDWTAIKDLGQARDVLRLNQYELTGLSENEKGRIIAFLDSWVVPNLTFNQTETEALEKNSSQDVNPVLIQVKKGRTIVREGDEIKSKELLFLETLKERKQPRRLAGEFFGTLFIVCFFLFGLWHYFSSRQKAHKEVRKPYLLVVLILIIGLIVTKVFMIAGDVVAERMSESLRNSTHFYFSAPLALGTFLTILLINVDLAVLCALIFAVFVALLTGESSLFIYSLTGSLAAIYALDQYRERSAIVRAGLAVGAVNVVTALVLQVYLSHGGFQWILVGVWAGGALVSGLFSAMLASWLLPILESLFEITTDIRLLELSNLNKPILRRLAIEAPGTYHHSITVGTLAEAAAEAIGANALLVRVGAYYHDIGKMKKPEYYIENQIYTSNKHESLSPSMSSLVIASHVKDGLAMAEEINLVPMVRDMIPQHHGTRLMMYFYQKARDSAEDKHGEVREDDFRYPGPKPQSKEAAILMLADQMEAAARTLQDPTPGQIRSMIKRLIQSTIQDGQFDECDVTMSELHRISQSFGRTITTMYHHRIEYPGFEFGKEVEEKQPQDQRIQ